ncbi:MAG: hypothetical protein K2Q23_02020 [Bryobacteraceae bacterium]|nr:hypothetical protein [Bryobacteraceae bacterium]
MAKRIVAVYDLNTNEKVVGEPYLDSSHPDVVRFAKDNANHGSVVLQRLMEADPDLPVVLIRAFDEKVCLIRTEWEGGSIKNPGWTDAHRWAVGLLKERGMSSVTNCSFGGFTHAMDGTGWESHSLAQLTGPGHIVLAGAGPGDGRPKRASWKVTTGGEVAVPAQQTVTAIYNFWSAGDGDDCDWVLEVFANGELHSLHAGRDIAPNLWNGRRHVTVTVEGEADVVLKVSRPQGATEELVGEIAFDCWLVESEGAEFLAFVNPELVAEPAVFPHVIGVGLVKGEYSPNQREPGAKPDVLIEEDGPISFRLPRLTALVAGWLKDEPALDVVAIRKRLGKFHVSAQTQNGVRVAL